jgi:hypothetical protein
MTMRRWTTSVGGALAFCALGSPAVATPITLTLTPSSVDVAPGDAFTVDLVVAGLERPPSLGAFDLDVLFDSTVASATGVTFASFLGDPDLGEALTDVVSFPGRVNVAAVSLLEPQTLDALQTNAFPLATLAFTAVASGTARFGVANVTLDDAFGNKLPVPEPSVMWLMGAGVAVLGVVRRRRGGARAGGRRGAIIACVLAAVLATASRADAQRPTKTFDILKDTAARSGAEFVQVDLLDQESRVERTFTAHVTCTGQSGFAKTENVAKQLAAQVSGSPTFMGRVTFTAVNLGPGPPANQGRLEGRVGVGQNVVFTRVVSSPCKDDAFHEVDVVRTDDLSLAELQLTGRTTSGSVTLALDQVEVTATTNGRTVSGVIQALMASLLNAGEAATSRANRLIIVNTRSIRATSSDPALTVQFGVDEACDVDLDGDVEADDVEAVFAARGSAATPDFDPRDADHDRAITVNDARICSVAATKYCLYRIASVTGPCNITPAPAAGDTVCASCVSNCPTLPAANCTIRVRTVGGTTQCRVQLVRAPLGAACQTCPANASIKAGITCP